MPIRKSIRHGLFWHHALTKLKNFGIVIDPYYLVREGAPLVEPDDRHRLPDGFEVRQLENGDIVAVQQLTQWATPAEVERRSNLGHVCLVLRSGDHIAGYTWADPHRCHEAVCPYELKDGEAYLYDAFVADEFRGGGLASRMRYASYVQLRELGVHSFVSISDFFNSASIKFKRRLGAQPMELYLHLALFGRDIGNWRLRTYDAESATWSSE